MQKPKQRKKRRRADAGRLVEAEEYTLATVAFVVAAAMAERKITKAQLALLLDVTPQRVSKILSAEGSLSFRLLARLADVLNYKIHFRFVELHVTERRPDGKLDMAVP